MLGKDIIDYLALHRCVNKQFRGLCTLSTIPRLKKRTFVIVNTSNQIGVTGHWFCVLKDDRGVIECFDSLGTSANYLKHFLPKKGKLRVNSSQVQSDVSHSCAQFAIYFVVHRLLNADQTFSDTLNTLFTDNTQDNERRVTQFIEDFQNGP